METVDLPINYGANKDVEEIGLVTHGAAMVNFYVDSNGNVARVPGLVELCDLGVAAKIDGMKWWSRQSKLIAQCNGKHFQVTTSGGTNSEISGDASQVGNKVYYSDFGTALYIANRGKIIKIPSSGNAAYLTDGDAPIDVSQVADIDKYLLALPYGLERVEYSEVLDPESWVGDWVTPESSPDLTSSIGVASDRIEMFGTDTIEGWRNDGSTPFVKDSAFTIPKGISAPDSHVFIENTWYWLDNERKVVRMNGRTPEVLSLTMNKYIQRFSTVADAIGGYTSFDGRPQYVLTFPTEDKTLCYDIYNSMWFELGRWNTGTASFDRYGGNSFEFATGWNFALVGDKSTGKIYKLDSTNYQDDGNTMKSMLRTASIHQGNPSRWKKCVRLDFYLKKANVASSGDSAQLMIKWRDNGKTTWNTERTVNLGYVGETDFHASIKSLGRYKSRQYEISITDNSPLVISRIQETFEWLGQ